MVKIIKKYFLKKVECLVNTYKIDDLICKLSKMTKCIYKGVYFIFSIKFLLIITIGLILIIITSC